MTTSQSVSTSLEVGRFITRFTLSLKLFHISHKKSLIGICLRLYNLNISVICAENKQLSRPLRKSHTTILYGAASGFHDVDVKAAMLIFVLLLINRMPNICSKIFHLCTFSLFCIQFTEILLPHPDHRIDIYLLDIKLELPDQPCVGGGVPTI